MSGGNCESIACSSVCCLPLLVQRASTGTVAVCLPHSLHRQPPRPPPIHAAAQEPPHTVCTLPKTCRLPLQNSPTLTLALHSRQSGLNSPSTFLLLFACHHTCNAAPPRSAMAAAGTAWCPCHRADGECRAACPLGSTVEHAKHHDAYVPTLLRLKCAQTSCRSRSTGGQPPGRTH